MKSHRDSQKRYYINNAIYFITTGTHNRYPYFEIDLLCKLFVHELNICMQLKKCKVYGYKVNPEHVHLLIQPLGEYNYSNIIHSLKRNFTRNANYIIGYDILSPHVKARLINLAFGEHYELLIESRNVLKNQYGINHKIPRFEWQSSFHDHIIRDEKDYYQHLKYIKNQWVRHNLKKNKWCYVHRERHNMSEAGLKKAGLMNPAF